MVNDYIRSKADEFENNISTFYDEDLLKSVSKEFNKRFPVDHIVNMTLDQYSLGFEDSFCHWLENKTEKIARISGIPANKFYVYSNKSLVQKNEFKIGKGEIVSRTEAEGEFLKLKESIIRLVRLAEKNDFRTIDTEIRLIFTSVKSKIIFLYFPDKITSIMAETMVEKACDLFGTWYHRDYSIESNHNLLTQIKRIDRFKTWDSYKISRFIVYLIKDDDNKNLLNEDTEEYKQLKTKERNLENFISNGISIGSNTIENAKSQIIEIRKRVKEIENSMGIYTRD